MCCSLVPSALSLMLLIYSVSLEEEHWVGGLEGQVLGVSVCTCPSYTYRRLRRPVSQAAVEQGNDPSLGGCEGVSCRQRCLQQIGQELERVSRKQRRGWDLALSSSLPLWPVPFYASDTKDPHEHTQIFLKLCTGQNSLRWSVWLVLLLLL